MGEHWPVLTVRPPWSWALLHGKDVENRTWSTDYRGSLLLHAGARSRWDPDGAASPFVRHEWDRHVRRIPGWPGLPFSDVELNRKTTLMPFGAVVAVAELVACHLSPDFGGTCGATRTLCSPWAARDQYHWLLSDVRPLPEPVPCRGMLGLWRLPDDVERLVREQLEEESCP